MVGRYREMMMGRSRCAGESSSETLRGGQQCVRAQEWYNGVVQRSGWGWVALRGHVMLLPAVLDVYGQCVGSQKQ